MKDISARPSRCLWPPLITGLGIAAMFALARYAPMEPGPGYMVPVGFALIALAVGVDLWVAAMFLRRRTALRPDRGASVLVTDGPFAVTRNPVYLSYLMLIIGLGMATRTIWALLVAAVVFVFLDRMAAVPEEKHLAARFGDAFEDYRQKVRRWL